MTWVRVDDKMHDHRKLRGIDCGAAGLWLLAASWCGSNSQEGFVPDTVPQRWDRSWRKHSVELVRRGLWEEAEDGTERGWRFVNWTEYNPRDPEAHVPLERLRWRRKQALKKNRTLVDAIVERDGGLCRYCGCRVNFMDRKGSSGGTYDHVDPDGENTLGNVVVACRRCNGRKRDRTPDEAGMTLLAPPGSEGTGSGAGSPGSSGAPSLEAGRDRVGTGSVKVGSGRVGPGPGLGRKLSQNGAGGG